MNFGSTEETKLEAQANIQAENNLSSVKIIRNSKGVNWEVKVKHEDPLTAMKIAYGIDEVLHGRYK